MDKNQLDKMEEMLATLINMVGNTNSRLDKVEEKLDKIEVRLDKVEERLDKMDERFDKMEARLDKMDERFDKVDVRLEKIQDDQRITRREIMEKLIVIQADQDHIWEKAVRNEREIAQVKSQLQS